LSGKNQFPAKISERLTQAVEYENMHYRAQGPVSGISQRLTFLPIKYSVLLASLRLRSGSFYFSKALGVRCFLFDLYGQTGILFVDLSALALALARVMESFESNCSGVFFCFVIEMIWDSQAFKVA